MNTYYFNNINSIEINKKDYKKLNENIWQKNNIVLNNQHYILYLLEFNNEYYLKSIKNYNTKTFNKIFNISLFNRYYEGKIIKLINYN